MSSTVSRITVAQGQYLEAGKTAHHWWNHAQPNSAVFALSVLPITTFQNNLGIDKLPAQAEVKNVSYKFVRAIAFEQSEELEVHFDVHNTGTTKIDYTVYMAVIV